MTNEKSRPTGTMDVEHAIARARRDRSDDRSYECRVCGQVFDAPSDAAGHLAEAHPDNMLGFRTVD